LTFAAVDSLTGKVVFFRGSISGGEHFDNDCEDFEKDGKTGLWGLRFRLDSKLLVAVGILNEDEERQGAFYYRFENGRFRLLYSVIVNKRDCQ